MTFLAKEVYRKKAKRRDPTISSLPEQMYIHYGYNNWDPLYTILEKDDPKVFEILQNELKRQILELEIELGENNLIEVMYH